jgi:hypothetical protein
VHNDTDELERGVLEGIPSWVEVCHSDSMDAWICADGHLEKSKDICTDTLLRVVDETVERARHP